MNNLSILPPSLTHNQEILVCREGDAVGEAQIREYDGSFVGDRVVFEETAVRSSFKDVEKPIVEPKFVASVAEVHTAIWSFNRFVGKSTANNETNDQSFTFYDNTFARQRKENGVYALQY